MKQTIGVALAALATASALNGCATSEPTDDQNASAPVQKIAITDTRGKVVTLDGPAERIGGTEWNVVEYAASLGVEPVGVSDVKGFETWVSAVTLPEGVSDIGTRGEPSIETVQSLGLDVLFVTDELVGDAMGQIERRTPIVVVAGGDAKDPIGAMFANLDVVAKATGTEERAAELRQEFEAKVAETKKLVAESGVADRPIAFSDAYEAGGKVSIRPYGEGSLIGAVLREVGVRSAWSTIEGLKTDPAYGLGETDVEGLTKLPDDTVFWYIANEEDGGDPYTSSLKDNRIWTSLPFVEEGAVHRFPDSIWMFGGPASMMQFLDAVQAAVKA
jgi:ABC-type Fe3+-hydroxamate transport system substrate-binding protein